MFKHRLLPIVCGIVASSLLAACGGSSSALKSSQIATVPDAQTQFGPQSGSAQQFAQSRTSTTFVPDRIIVIVMENHSFDDIIGRTGPVGTHLFAPFLTQLAQTSRLATLYFGVSHPSLPNYLALLAGNTFGVTDDNTSCYAVPLVFPCHGWNQPNLVDSLEAAGISWASYNQSMPSDGFRGVQYPSAGDGLYRQKHDPFMYFKDIATNPARLKNIRTFKDLNNIINNGFLPRFSFIVPDECHDMHGSTPFCPGPQLIENGDTEVQTIVNAILASGSFTQRSLIFITFDEAELSNQGCCDSQPVLGGGHVPTIIIAGVPGALASAQLYNHYSILSTIETLWNLPKLGFTSDTTNVKPMLDLVP